VTGPPTDDVLTHRRWRKAILLLLDRDRRAGGFPGIAVVWDEIYHAVGTGRVKPGPERIRRALDDLIDNRLVEAIPHSIRPNVECYRITGRGADFIRADFPWRKIDDFSGEQRFGG